MDLDQLESKLKQISLSTSTPSAPGAVSTSSTTETRPVSVTRKVNSVSDEDVKSYIDKVIPSWNDLQTIYAGRWDREKTKFQTHLKANFAALVERFASGKQELFVLSAAVGIENIKVLIAPVDPRTHTLKYDENTQAAWVKELYQMLHREFKPFVKKSM